MGSLVKHCDHTLGFLDVMALSVAYPVNQCMCDDTGFQGTELEAWKGSRMPRINDLAITTDGSHMVSSIQFWDGPDK